MFNGDIIVSKWMFPKIGVPQNGWFIMETPINMDDLGGTPIFGNTQMLDDKLHMVLWFFEIGAGHVGSSGADVHWILFELNW